MNIIFLSNIAIFHTIETKVLTDTFMRVSEFYESNQYKGKFNITKQNIMQLYTEIGEGENYFDVFEGYNFPASYIKTFFEVNQPDALEYALTTLPASTTYVIGYLTGDQQVLIHELAHAFYYSFDEYQSKANAIIDTLSVTVKEILIKWFIKNGYDQHVYQDELQAYIVEDLLEDLIENEEELNVVFKNTREHFDQLRALFYTTLKAMEGHEVVDLN